MFKKIDLHICNRSSNHRDGYTDWRYYCSTNQHKTLTSAIESLTVNNSPLAEPVFDIRRCKAGQLGFTTTGHNKIMAIFSE